MKILVIDDSAFMRSFVKRICTKGGHVVIEAKNAEEAILAFNREKPALIFLDIVMPGKDGLYILRKIRSCNNKAPIVMLTSLGGQDKIVEECIASGASDFIKKPFAEEEVLAMIESYNKVHSKVKENRK